MAENRSLEYWTVWYPKAASTGLLLARGLLDPTRQIILHAASPVITVEVTDAHSRRLAFGQDLEQTTSSPMCCLTRWGDEIRREDRWLTSADIGLPVLLPGGEVGILQAWWHADDKKEWRWQVEFYNTTR